MRLRNSVWALPIASAVTLFPLSNSLRRQSTAVEKDPLSLFKEAQTVDAAVEVATFEASFDAAVQKSL